VHWTMCTIISLTFLFSFLVFLSCRHGVFRGFNGGSGPSPHGKRLRTRSRHHLFLESKPSRRPCSTTKRRVLDKKEKKKNWIKSSLDTNASNECTLTWRLLMRPIFTPLQFP
jgi:hypothetical protein